MKVRVKVEEFPENVEDMTCGRGYYSEVVEVPSPSIAVVQVAKAVSVLVEEWGESPSAVPPEDALLEAGLLGPRMHRKIKKLKEGSAVSVDLSDASTAETPSSVGVLSLDTLQ